MPPDLPTTLANLIVQDNAVLFVGSTLRPSASHPHLTDALAEALATRLLARLPGSRLDERTLPAVAEAFEAATDRVELIRALREEMARLEPGRDPIHQLIADAVLPSTKVITMRFDQALEQTLERFGKEYVVIARDVDVSSFDETRIVLIKLLGDSAQEKSLVLTKTDINSFLSRLPALSDVIRALFATKTLIFLGYDLNSDLFQRFFEQVNHNLSAFSRPAYAIVEGPVDELKRLTWEKKNVKLFVREPVAFLEALAQAVKQATPPAPPAPPPSLPLPPRPYKGAESFTRADSAIFEGRGEERTRLANRLLARRLVLLYGESGSGKTSLLQAGIQPELERQHAGLAITLPTAGESLATGWLRALREQGHDAGEGDGALPALIRAWGQANNAPLVLALDQAEGFFLAYSAPEQEAALATMRELLHDRSLDVRLLLVVREDFLGRLPALEASLPGLMEASFRLEALRREQARAAIEEPARLFGVRWESALVERLLVELYDGARGGIAPPPLQLVCSTLYRRTIEEGNGRAEQRITLAQYEALGGTEAILGGFLDQTLLSLPAAQQPAARSLLAALVSSSGVKQRLALPYLARVAELSPAEADAILNHLCEQGVVRRYEIGAGGAGQAARLEYELTHEFLAAHIARWLDETFWLVQRAREIVRAALPAWQAELALLPPAQLAGSHRPTQAPAAERGRSSDALCVGGGLRQSGRGMGGGDGAGGTPRPPAAPAGPRRAGGKQPGRPSDRAGSVAGGHGCAGRARPGRPGRAPACGRAGCPDGGGPRRRPGCCRRAAPGGGAGYPSHLCRGTRPPACPA